MKKIILVTGASSGLGLSMANELSAEGHTVYGTTRDISKPKSVAFRLLEMDVTNNQSVDAAIREILQAEGKIDVLINNAGNGIAGPLYAMPVEYAQKQFDVNFFGVVRVCSAVLPAMIEQRQGLVINIGSLAGLFGSPYQGLFSASKFALEGYSQSLRMELKNTGIRVTIVNPGAFKTGFTRNRENVPFTLNHEILRKEFKAALSRIETYEKYGSRPITLALLICKIVARRTPAHRYVIAGFDQTIIFNLKKLLPNSTFVKLINDHYGMK
jgi:short-subunit dehydrogenase